jgi:hypothetical protein
MNLSAAIVVLTGATGATARRLAGRTRTLFIHGPQPPDQTEDLLAELRASVRGCGAVPAGRLRQPDRGTEARGHRARSDPITSTC